MIRSRPSGSHPPAVCLLVCHTTSCRLTMQTQKQTAKFFSEDLIYRSGRDGKCQVGLVTGSYDESEDEDDSEHDSSHEKEKVAPGFTKVAWYPTGKTQIIAENKVSFFGE